MMGKVLYMRKGEKHTAPRVGLPSGYTELEYIQSSGTQYIDTGFMPNQDTRIVVDSVFTNETEGVLFGSRTSSAANNFSFLNTGELAYRADYNTTQASLSVKKTSRFILDMNKNALSFDGETVNTFTYAAFQGTYPLYLFVLNSAGSPASYAETILYSCQIYDNGTLVRDFVPCVNDLGEIGLYDKVTKAFFGNAGTGAFGAGDVVEYQLPDGYEELSYIQSSGTQYIDTGFAHNQDTRVVMDVYPDAHSSNAWLFEGRNSSSAACKTVMWLNGYTTWYGYYNDSSTRQAFEGLASSERLLIDHDKNTCTVNGYSYTWDVVEFQSNYNLVLLACNTAGTVSGCASAKLYSCRIYDNGACVRWYVPVVNEGGNIGLYDVITRTFYGNAGTGTFTGSEVA